MRLLRILEPFDKPGRRTDLAKLIIGIGVTPVAVYKLKRVDSDFFAEE